MWSPALAGLMTAALLTASIDTAAQAPAEPPNPLTSVKRLKCRFPTASPADRLGILQRLQETVAEERVAGRAWRQRTGIPLVGVDGGKRLYNTQADGRGGIRHGSSIARNVPGIVPGICPYFCVLSQDWETIGQPPHRWGCAVERLDWQGDIRRRLCSGLRRIPFRRPDSAQPRGSTGRRRRGRLLVSQARLAGRALPGHRRDRPVTEFG